MTYLPSIDTIPAYGAHGRLVNAIVETPCGSQNKFRFHPETGMFELGSVLPAGHTFPFEFGFIPSTRGEDGDPLDVLILMDAPTFAGCRVCVRIIGILEATQRGKKNKVERNDRIIAVAQNSHRHQRVKNLKDLGKTLVAERFPPPLIALAPLCSSGSDRSTLNRRSAYCPTCTWTRNREFNPR